MDFNKYSSNILHRAKPGKGLPLLIQDEADVAFVLQQSNQDVKYNYQLASGSGCATAKTIWSFCQ